MHLISINPYICVSCLIADHPESIDAAAALNVVAYRGHQADEVPPRPCIIGTEQQGPGCRGDDLSHVKKHPPNIYPVQRCGSTLESFLAPDDEALSGKVDGGVHIVPWAVHVIPLALGGGVLDVPDVA